MSTGWHSITVTPPVNAPLICIQYTGGIPALLFMTFDGENYRWEGTENVSSTIPTHWHLHRQDEKS